MTRRGLFAAVAGLAVGAKAIKSGAVIGGRDTRCSFARLEPGDSAIHSTYRGRCLESLPYPTEAQMAEVGRLIGEIEAKTRRHNQMIVDYLTRKALS